MSTQRKRVRTHNDKEKKQKHEYLHSPQDGSWFKHLGIAWYVLFVVFVCIYTSSKSRGWQGLQRFSNTAEFLDIFLWRQILVEVAATHELRIKDTTINHTATGLKRLGRKTEIIFETVGAFIRAVPASRFFAHSFFALVPAVPRRRIQTPTPLPCLPLPLHIPLKRSSDNATARPQPSPPALASQQRKNNNTVQ